MIFNPGNEPSFTTPYLFNFINRQDLTVYYTHKFARAYYSPTPTGLPGNSDAGAMESWPRHSIESSCKGMFFISSCYFSLAGAGA
ncbi:glycosyl hydrolase family 92-domain-containing protein [Diaporthe sp. PMI_573]|nr:glycosyl hydrolase family 92-domain-containing protein [Diaporthaceae sp. PMI_573]KAH8754553.1 glycosyl hydrolase family 92-domain-containing protein [Diaporthaceae sp. PMI_573]